MNTTIHQYLQQGCLTKTDRLFSLLHTDLPYFFNADKAAAEFRKNTDQYHLAGTSERIEIKEYSGKNPVVKKIAAYLNHTIKNEIVMALVHGSTGTDEIIQYSDFDGIVIVKDECLAAPQRIKRLAIQLNVMHGMMLELDPLQHHGWMICSERDLKEYDDAAFPSELYRYATSLTGAGSLTFQLKPNCDYEKPFRTLSERLLNTTAGKCPLTLYEIKTLLSEFMLLPALYIQAKKKKGIFKKDSFVAAAEFFTAEEWQIMNTISAIRSSWNYKAKISSEKKAWKFRRVPVIAQYFHTSAPKEFVEKTEHLFPNMHTLIRLMQERITA